VNRIFYYSVILFGQVAIVQALNAGDREFDTYCRQIFYLYSHSAVERGGGFRSAIKLCALSQLRLDLDLC